MQLYFLRHGEADWPGWTKPDDERPLTDFGKKEVRQVAKFLNRLKVKPGLIVTSPLPRALQTAEVAAEQLKTKLRQDEALEPGFGVSELRTVLKRHRSKVLMLVGHEPDFSSVISALTGACLKLSKAGVALVDIDPEAQRRKTSLAVPAEIRAQSEIGFSRDQLRRSCSHRRAASHLARFCTKRTAGCGYRTKYSREDWRAMILANPWVLRLRLEKQRAKPVPA